jgi:hypothetical protein
MPVYRVTYGFAGANQGWTETHAMSQSVTTALAALPFTVAVAQARVAMLGSPFVLNGTRISIYSDGGVPPNRIRIRNVILDKKIYAYNAAVGTVAPPSEPTPVQLQAQGFAAGTAPANYQGNENWCYLGGPFDDCVTNAGQVLPDKINLQNAFNTWKAAMIAANMGWLAVTKVGPQLPITTITNNANAQLVFLVGGDTVPPLVDGTVYNIRAAGINFGHSPANGAFVATYNATTHTFTTSEQVAIKLMQSGGYVQPYVRTLTFVPYGNLVLALQTIKHKRGKPFLSLPGRARKRTRA